MCIRTKLNFKEEGENVWRIFETKEQAEEYKKKHELYVMIPIYSKIKKKWCLIFDLKVRQ